MSEMQAMTPGPWQWDGVAVSNVGEVPWMEWQPMDPYLGEDRGQEYHEARRQADGAFIAAAPTVIAELRAALLEETAKRLMFQELYTEPLSYEANAVALDWDTVKDADRAAFRAKAQAALLTR